MGGNFKLRIFREIPERNGASHRFFFFQQPAASGLPLSINEVIYGDEILAGRTIAFGSVLCRGLPGRSARTDEREDRQIGASPRAKPRSPAEPNEIGFRPLAFRDFSAYLSKPQATGEPPTWSALASGIIQTTGSPRGYLYTNENFGDFTWRLEFRYLPREENPAPDAMAKYNTGFLIYVPDENKLWPRSLEVQGRYDEMGQVKSNARDVMITITLDDEQARQTARKPVGEWNAVEIVSRDGAVTSYLNGAKISHSEPGELKSGRIGLQAEDYAVEFRNLRIRRD